MEKALEEKLAALPREPGVYLMKDKAGKVIYVGKATNLRERLRSYFSAADPRFFVPLLERVLGDIETVVVGSEKEALLLENELIRRHKPRFNVRPREGRNFIYLRIDPGRRYPRLEVTRAVRPDGARYFGPYPLAAKLRETLRVVNRHFHLRTCADHDPSTHKRPCLLCQIARLPAPSVYDIPPDEYRRHVEEAIMFLEGKRSDLLAALRRRMDEASEAMRFEAAARLRDQLEAVEQTLEPQQIVAAGSVDQDVVALAREGERLSIYLLFVRQGKVIGGRAFLFRGQAFPDRELLASFLSLYYQSGNYVPDEVLLPLEIESQADLADLLGGTKGRPVSLRVPKRGKRRALLELSQRNAEAALRPEKEAPEDLPARLKERLDLTRLPRHMECFDVSHFQGGIVVASKVAMTDTRLDKDRYRRYRITSVQVGDDFAALFEAVKRRLRRGIEEDDLPDLLVIDGGKGQLASALAALKELGLHLDVIALAKAKSGEIAKPERIFLPGRKEPLVLKQDSPELLLLARLRDEAHRFAITYQRKLLRKARMRSPLDAIPGVGSVRRRALLRRFGSLNKIRAASVEELSEAEGVGPETARRIFNHLHPKQGHAAAVHPG